MGKSEISILQLLFGHDGHNVKLIRLHVSVGDRTYKAARKLQEKTGLVKIVPCNRNPDYDAWIYRHDERTDWGFDDAAN